MGVNIKLVWAEFSTLSQAVLMMCMYFIYVDTYPHLWLKTRPRFGPVSLSLSMLKPGNTKGGSITVPLTSCLTGLDQSVLQIKTKIVSCHTANSKPVKQEVNGTEILPSLVFPAETHASTWRQKLAPYFPSLEKIVQLLAVLYIFLNFLLETYPI